MAREKKETAQEQIRKEGRFGPINRKPEKRTTDASREETTLPSQVLPFVNPKGQYCFVMVAATKPAQTPNQPWTKVSYGNQKNGTLPTVKAKQHGRRILFPRQSGSQLKSEADLILALNKSLQRAKVEPKVRFSRVQYAPSGSISALCKQRLQKNIINY